MDISAVLISDLREAGLLAERESWLTEKGRDWLRELEACETNEVAEDWAADLVLSVNAISR
jgi:hypothetical protein